MTSKYQQVSINGMLVKSELRLSLTVSLPRTRLICQHKLPGELSLNFFKFDL